jgi:Mg-chelatase subunit ChlD
MTRTLMRWPALAAALGLCLGATARADTKKPEPKKEKPKVEVVFCLDTTGSMGGLIAAAKAKIWSICNQVASGKPTPDLRVGLVAYRDKGDAYVTQVLDLTADLDAVHARLKTFQAQGGGDTPESVNQALYDSVHKIKWSTDRKTLRIIFLVGDAPPHMDYADDVKYPVTCKEACKKGIIINTVQCGGDPECTKFWKDICAKAEGSFIQIEQNGGVVAVATPFDKRLGEINDELARSTLVFGDRRKQMEGKDKAREATALPAESKADRAGFGGKGGGRVATYDLLDAIKAKEVDLKKLKKEELPPQLQKLDEKGQKEYLDKLGKKRAVLAKEARELDTKRAEFIKKELEKKGGKNAFDTQVLQTLRKQAKKHKIDY